MDQFLNDVLPMQGDICGYIESDGKTIVAIVDGPCQCGHCGMWITWGDTRRFVVSGDRRAHVCPKELLFPAAGKLIGQRFDSFEASQTALAAYLIT